MNIVFMKLKLWFIQQNYFFQNLHTFGILLFQAIVIAWYTISIELAEYACTQSIIKKSFSSDCENIEDVPDDSEEQYYEEPDLSRGVEGVDYGIVYGTSNEEPDSEA
jgi:hypothetical protein